MKAWTRVLVTGALSTACAADPARPGGDGPPSPPELPLELVQPRNSGNGQSALVASYLPEPLTVRVMRGETPVSGVRVQWVPGNPSARVEPINDTSDVNGYVSARFFTGPVAGSQGAVAVLDGKWLGMRFEVQPRAPFLIRRTSSGDSIPHDYYPMMSIRVEDEYGNGIPAVEIHWDLRSEVHANLTIYEYPTDAHGRASLGMYLGVPQLNAIVSADLPRYPGVPPLIVSVKSF